ncbi:HNH endonuclease [uncultured Metabacillus sp.]|uniref:HNH endonuclease n=1 Tax=uncultured Metabacillus sp. TaxID=2860135 RepID=UPI002622F251|nr:HNH endonuclease [uncultured Metabacillus sp.]
MIKVNKCRECDIEYETKSFKSLFCSDKCSQRHRRKIEKKKKERELKCPNCDIVFTTSNTRKKFCTIKCKDEYKNNKKLKGTLEKKCVICESSFTVEGKARQSVFCSEECRKQRWRLKLVEKQCPVCEKMFKGNHNQVCCSPKCANEKRKVRIEINCPTCKENFYVEPNKAHRKFCSRKCASKSREVDKETPNCKCDNCEEEFYRPLAQQKGHEHHFCSRKCNGEFNSKYGLVAGKNNGNYTGSFDRHKKYYGEDWLPQRRKARLRDNYTCQQCGITEDEYGMELSVHHITPFVAFKDTKEANKLDNLLCVCEPCHRKIHSGENHPRNYKKYIDL